MTSSKSWRAQRCLPSVASPSSGLSVSDVESILGSDGQSQEPYSDESGFDNYDESDMSAASEDGYDQNDYRHPESMFDEQPTMASAFIAAALQEHRTPDTPASAITTHAPSAAVDDDTVAAEGSGRDTELVQLCEGSPIVGVEPGLRRRMIQQGYELSARKANKNTNVDWFACLASKLYRTDKFGQKTMLVSRTLLNSVTKMNAGARTFLQSLAAKFQSPSHSNSTSAGERQGGMKFLLQVRCTDKMFHREGCWGDTEKHTCECDVSRQKLSREILSVFAEHDLAANQPIIFFDGYIHEESARVTKEEQARLDTMHHFSMNYSVTEYKTRNNLADTSLKRMVYVSLCACMYV